MDGTLQTTTEKDLLSSRGPVVVSSETEVPLKNTTEFPVYPTTTPYTSRTIITTPEPPTSTLLSSTRKKKKVKKPVEVSAVTSTASTRSTTQPSTATTIASITSTTTASLVMVKTTEGTTLASALAVETEPPFYYEQEGWPSDYEYQATSDQMTHDLEVLRTMLLPEGSSAQALPPPSLVVPEEPVVPQTVSQSAPSASYEPWENISSTEEPIVGQIPEKPAVVMSDTLSPLLSFFDMLQDDMVRTLTQPSPHPLPIPSSNYSINTARVNKNSTTTISTTTSTTTTTTSTTLSPPLASDLPPVPAMPQETSEDTSLVSFFPQFDTGSIFKSATGMGIKILSSFVDGLRNVTIDQDVVKDTNHSGDGKIQYPLRSPTQELKDMDSDIGLEVVYEDFDSSDQQDSLYPHYVPKIKKTPRGSKDDMTVTESLSSAVWEEIKPAYDALMENGDTQYMPFDETFVEPTDEPSALTTPLTLNAIRWASKPGLSSHKNSLWLSWMFGLPIDTTTPLITTTEMPTTTPPPTTEQTMRLYDVISWLSESADPKQDSSTLEGMELMVPILKLAAESVADVLGVEEAIPEVSTEDPWRSGFFDVHNKNGDTAVQAMIRQYSHVGEHHVDHLDHQHHNQKSKESNPPAQKSSNLPLMQILPDATSLLSGLPIMKIFGGNDEMAHEAKHEAPPQLPAYRNQAQSGSWWYQNQGRVTETPHVSVRQHESVTHALFPPVVTEEEEEYDPNYEYDPELSSWNNVFPEVERRKMNRKLKPKKAPEPESSDYEWLEHSDPMDQEINHQKDEMIVNYDREKQIPVDGEEDHEDTRSSEDKRRITPQRLMATPSDDPIEGLGDVLSKYLLSWMPEPNTESSRPLKREKRIKREVGMREDDVPQSSPFSLDSLSTLATKILPALNSFMAKFPSKITTSTPLPELKYDIWNQNSGDEPPPEHQRELPSGSPQVTTSKLNDVYLRMMEVPLPDSVRENFRLVISAIGDYMAQRKVEVRGYAKDAVASVAADASDFIVEKFSSEDTTQRAKVMLNYDDSEDDEWYESTEFIVSVSIGGFFLLLALIGLLSYSLCKKSSNNDFNVVSQHVYDGGRGSVGTFDSTRSDFAYRKNVAVISSENIEPVQRL